MRNTNLKTPIFIITTAIIALSSCGSSGVTEVKNTPSAAQTDLSTPTTVPGLTGGYAPYNYAFTTCGKEPKAISGLVETDNLLNVRIRAETAPQNGCYADASKVIPYNARYNCARFKLTMQVKMGTDADKPTVHADTTWVDRATFITDPLTAPGTDGCTGSKSEVVYNLSNHLFASHGLVRFQIESVETDHMCNYYNYCKQNLWQTGCAWAAYQSPQYMCPLKAVYQYHKTAGQIDVQTDGTVF